MRGVGGADCLQLSLLLLDLFCIQRIVTNTHAARSNEEHIHACTSVCMCACTLTHTIATILICLLFASCYRKSGKKNNNVFLYCNLASINSPDTWPFWVDPSRRHSIAQSRCDRQASRLFRFQFQLDHRRRRHHPITSLTMRKLHSDRVIVF